MKTIRLITILLLFASFSLAKTVTLRPTGDVSISSQERNTSFGNSDTLAVGHDANTQWETFIRFDLSLIPAGSQITSVKLQMTRFDRTGTCWLYGLSRDNWHEGDCWNTHYSGPDWTSLFFDSHSLSACSGGNNALWEWPSTPSFVYYIQYLVDSSNDRASMGLLCSDDIVGFMSRESGATSPKLIVTYKASGPPSSLEIQGPGTVNENSGAQYACIAKYGDGSTEEVTPTWTDSSPFASIDDAGFLTALSFSGTLSCRITAVFEGLTTTRTVSLVEVQPPAPPREEGTLQFKSTGMSVTEGWKKIRLRVTRSGDASGTARVTFRTVSKTALSGQDYGGKSGTLTWGEGDTSDKVIAVSILDDGKHEGNEVFKVLLLNASGAALASPKSAKVTIMDNGD